MMQVPHQFKIGERVRIKSDAFHVDEGDADPIDVAARGQVGEIIDYIEPESDTPVFCVNTFMGIVYPLYEELEQIT